MSIDVATVPTSSPNTADRIAARVVDAVKVYGRGSTEVRALDGVTIDFASGQWTAIIGPSGSGKWTLLHCTAGLVIGVGAVRLEVFSATAAG